MSLRKIISGGQTGVDQLALDVAIELGLEHGGCCPKGRACEGGSIPDRYQLSELDTDSYPVRTRRNVADADATVVFMDRIEGAGSRLTTNECSKTNKPYCWIHIVDLSFPVHGFIENVIEMIRKEKVEVLNVAGTRGSGCRPEFLQAVRHILECVIKATRAHGDQRSGGAEA